MNKKLSSLILAGALLGGMAVSAAEFSVAVVDVPQVVTASAKVQSLKKEQQAKAEEVLKFVEKARKDVASVSDVKKKQALEEKYNKELQAKKEKMDAEYAAKLKEIDASISRQIEAKAKSDGYDVVLSKGIVLYGGTDITSELVKIVK